MFEKEKTKRELIEELVRLRQEMAELKDENSALKQVLHQTQVEANNLRATEQHQRELMEALLQQVASKNQAVLNTLKKSEANLRAILDNSSLPFILIDKSGKIQDFNKPAYDGIKVSFGKEIERNSSIRDFVPEVHLNEFNRNFEQAIQGNSVRIEKNIHIGDSDRWFEFRYNPVFSDDGQVLGVCFGCLDIDQQKQMINALAINEARLLAELQSVLVINRALVSELNLNTLLEFIITQAEHLMNADGSLVLLLTEDNQQLQVASPNEAWSPVRPGTQIPFHGSLAERAIASQRVQMRNQVHLEEEAVSWPALLQPAEVSSLLCAPLTVRHVNLGVLLVWSRHEQSFTKNDTRLIGLFADQAALALHNAQLYAENRKMAIEQERHRLARGLHDSVNQSLQSIGLVAEATLRLLGPEAAGNIRNRIEFIRMLATTAFIEMREQLYDLQPADLIDKGLVEALREYIDAVSTQFSLITEFIPDEDLSLSTYQQGSVYLIAREALWNVVKHAQATKVEVTLSRAGDQIIFTLVDNGVGFDPARQEALEKLGIRNMKERARLLEGTFELHSQPGLGTSLAVYFPLNPPQS